MEFEAPIIILEHGGIARDCEPLTVGIPVPKGILMDTVGLVLLDPERGLLPLQSQPLAHWQDGSVKWILLDFQVWISAGATKELLLQHKETRQENLSPQLIINERATELIIDSGAACFHVNTEIFRPFSGVVVDGRQLLSRQGSSVILTDQNGVKNQAVVSSWEWETRGPLRATVKLTGNFLTEKKKEQLSFIARLYFFAGLSTCQIDLTLWNPRAAEHPGGLWPQ